MRASRLLTGAKGLGLDEVSRLGPLQGRGGQPSRDGGRIELRHQASWRWSAVIASVITEFDEVPQRSDGSAVACVRAAGRAIKLAASYLLVPPLLVPFGTAIALLSKL